MCQCLVLLTFVYPSFDKSASNICESKIWTTIGQTPWAHPYSTWYHQFIEFPFQALRVASKLGEYTLVDRGTWCSIEDGVTDKLEIFVSLQGNQLQAPKRADFSSRPWELIWKRTPCSTLRTHSLGRLGRTRLWQLHLWTG